MTVGLGLGACESATTENPELPPGVDGPEEIHTGQGSIFGPGGIAGLFSSQDERTGGGAPGIGVNAFLWRASLDTMSIWPIVSADPFGGVIITDWYAPPATPNERFKLNIYILDRTLRADGLRVAAFRQVRTSAGEWQNAAVQPETTGRLEEAILMRARQIRNQTAQNR